MWSEQSRSYSCLFCSLVILCRLNLPPLNWYKPYQALNYVNVEFLRNFFLYVCCRRYRNSNLLPIFPKEKSRSLEYVKKKMNLVHLIPSPMHYQLITWAAKLNILLPPQIICSTQVGSPSVSLWYVLWTALRSGHWPDERRYISNHFIHSFIHHQISNIIRSFLWQQKQSSIIICWMVQKLQVFVKIRWE